MSSRHVQLLNLLLEQGEMTLEALAAKARHFYTVKNPQKALLRDLSYLAQVWRRSRSGSRRRGGMRAVANLDWPRQITETEFFRRVREMPKGKLYGFLSR